jgi:hypothetical protein
MSEIPSPKRSLWSQVLPILTAVGLVAGLIAGIYAAVSFIDFRIREQIRQPPFLQELARATRPTAVFDVQGSVIFDMGAMAYIDAIEIDTIRADDEFLWNFQIVIEPNVLLENQPILEPLDLPYLVKGERGPMYEWHFTLIIGGVMGWPGDPEFLARQRFRIEIIP